MTPMRPTLTGYLALPCLLAACSSPIIPDETIQLTSTMSFTAADVVMTGAVVGLAYLIIDPLAPNWDVRETKLSDTRYRIDMRKKRITTGGDGESIDLFHRQAEQLAATAKATGYSILSWNEGVDSDFPIARRWSRGVIELTGPVSADR
jgi:hypothetical protein